MKIPGTRNISLPQNSAALLTALDRALDEKTYQIVDGNALEEVLNSDTNEFSTFIQFEIDENDPKELADRIYEMVSHACSPEVIEVHENYQLVGIDYCVYSFK